jgi:hypothetical protein
MEIGIAGHWNGKPIPVCQLSKGASWAFVA